MYINITCTEIIKTNFVQHIDTNIKYITFFHMKHFTIEYSTTVAM
jgi:hypothetical protein